MKLKNWAAIALFISSYSPLSLILLIQDFNTKTKSLDNPKTALALLGISIASVFILFLTMHAMRQGDLITVTRVSNQSGELVNYTIPYMISFFGFKLSDYQSLACFLIFMVLMCILTVRTQNIFINPILAIVGYGLYDVEFTRGKEECHAILLSNQKIHRDQKCYVRPISDFLYRVTETNPKA